MENSKLLAILQKIVKTMTKDQFLKVCEMVYDFVTKEVTR